MPQLSSISLPPQLNGGYIQNIPSLKNGLSLKIKTNVTFFVGENGSGKSTLLEGIAERCGFNMRGGNPNHNLTTSWRFEGYKSVVARELMLGMPPRPVTDGFFMRAESFFNFASYIDELAEDDNRILRAYGGRSLHEQSHGESFLSLFNNQFENGLYILDEPEAALSPARVLAFMSVINELDKSGRAQFLIATHSPILICYPGATIFQFDEDGVRETTYPETEHFSLTKAFLNNPDLYLHHLMK